MPKAKELSLYSETELETKAAEGFPVSCPTLDLAATWNAGDRNLLIYRPPDQVVSKIHQATAGQKAPQVCAVTWKPDGQFLALGWSDGVVRLMGLENNKAAHNIPVTKSPEAHIVHIGWATTSITADRGRDRASAGTRIRDGMPGEWSVGETKALLHLPQELIFLEVETALPKMSPLPVSSAGAGEDATVFTIRSGIDFFFQTPKRDTYDQVNVMIIGTSDGRLQLSIHDSFIVGSFACPTPHSPASHMIHHASHPRVSTHCLVLAQGRDAPDEVHLVPMDLPFIRSSPINLALLSSKVTTLQTLLRYLRQTCLHMSVEWKNARELPARFIKAVQGDLEAMETGPRDIVPALYHLVLTGHAYEPLQEWLVDSLGERGHKRWEKAVVAGLEGLRSLVHQNLMPALERCSVILGRLRGLALFHHEDRQDIGFSLAHIDKVLDIISSLSLVGHRALIHIMDELQHFRTFSTWLRFHIDRLASSGSGAVDELTEKEATMDNVRVLTYIQKYMTTSPLRLFFDDVSEEDCAAACKMLDDAGTPLLHLCDEQVKKQEAGQPGITAIPRVDFLVGYLAAWSGKIFGSIAEAKRRSVRFGRPMRLSIGQPVGKMDIRMSCSERGETGIIYTVLSSKVDSSKVFIFRSGIIVRDGISSNQPMACCGIHLQGRSLIDLKFLDETTLLFLLNDSDNKPVIASVSVNHEDLGYTPYNPRHPTDLICRPAGKSLSEFRLPSVRQGPNPVQMEVRESSDARGHIAARIILLGENRTTLCTLIFPPEARR